MCKEYRKSDIDYLINQFQKLTEERVHKLPSEFIEEKRYLPRGLTPKPGYYDYDYTPYLREIIDNFDMGSPIRKIAVLKSAQIGATVGLIESIILYHIGAVPLPQLFVTADKSLAEKTMITRIEPMLEYSGMKDLIYSQYGNAKHRTGSTKLSKEYPGGHLHLIGAKNPDAFRGVTYPRMYLDEIDTYSGNLKGEGNTIGLVDNRTNAFAQTRKILYTGTPLIQQSSQIWKLFLQGDQRYYNVPCPYCGEFQDLKWHGVTDDGKIFGIKFEIDKTGLPIEDTIGYSCKFCDKIIFNYHKTEMLSKGKWIATVKSQEPDLISYSINSLYSPVGMLSWKDLVYEWLKCWNVETNRPKDIEKYREFRNTKQGLPFEHKGEQIRTEKVQKYRNYKYLKNEINNKEFKKDSGSEILLLTAAVDVQKNNIFVHVIGWTEGKRNYTIDFFSIDGVVEDYNSTVWKQLDKILSEKIWIDNEDREYKIIQTVIDSGHYTDYVYNFCKQYSSGVFAIKGEERISYKLVFKEFHAETLKKAGLPIAFHVNTTLIKDRIASMFDLRWETNNLQEPGYINFPEDIRDDVLDQFEAEERINEIDKITNKWIRTRWKLISGRANHMFDCFCYNICNLEILADFICRNELDLKYLNWEEFWEWCKKGYFYKQN